MRRYRRWVLRRRLRRAVSLVKAAQLIDPENPDVDRWMEEGKDLLRACLGAMSADDRKKERPRAAKHGA